jgi:ArsR family transcriptional regulator
MIEALENRHLTVTDLMERLHQSQVTISKHLTILRHSGVVQSRVEGAYRRYSISYPNVLNILHCVRQHSRRGMK